MKIPIKKNKTQNKNVFIEFLTEPNPLKTIKQNILSPLYDNPINTKDKII